MKEAVTWNLPTLHIASRLSPLFHLLEHLLDFFGCGYVLYTHAPALAQDLRILTVEIGGIFLPPLVQVQPTLFPPE